MSSRARRFFPFFLPLVNNRLLSCLLVQPWRVYDSFYSCPLWDSFLFFDAFSGLGLWVAPPRPAVTYCRRGQLCSPRTPRTPHPIGSSPLSSLVNFFHPCCLAQRDVWHPDHVRWTPPCPLRAGSSALGPPAKLSTSQRPSPLACVSAQWRELPRLACRMRGRLEQQSWPAHRSNCILSKSHRITCSPPRSAPWHGGCRVRSR